MIKPISLKQFSDYTYLEAFDRGGLCEDETAAFIYPDEEKQLLYDIDSIVSVKSYDGGTVYEQGKDFVLKNGKLALSGNSAIPVMTPEIYYSDGEQPILKVLKPDGGESPCYFNGSGTLSKYQIRITYTHEESHGLLPPCKGRYGRFLSLLESGENVTVFFHGDSITYGCDASLSHGLPPYQPSFRSCSSAHLPVYTIVPSVSLCRKRITLTAGISPKFRGGTKAR